MVFLRRLLVFAIAVYWIGIFALTHTPQQHLPRVKVGDKAAHFLAYSVLGGMLYLYLWIKTPAARGSAWVVLGIAAIYGLADELLQEYIPGINRYGDYEDWLADMHGAALAVGVLALIRWALRQSDRRREADALMELY